jgi:hypothetical protein
MANRLSSVLAIRDSEFDTINNMMPLGRILIVLGIVLFVMGLLLNYSHLFSFLHLGRLPGDIRIRRGNFSFFFPLTTCIILSVLFTLIFYIFRK